MNSVDNSIISLKQQITKSDIGTYKFIAEAFNVKIETVVKWFILIIVFVFDPLAVSLLLAYNIASSKKEVLENNKNINNENLDIDTFGGNTNNNDSKNEQKVEHANPKEDPSKKDYHNYSFCNRSSRV
jgi:phage shock protein PspC (stress-responsive transcriptional regulator)